MLVLSRSLEEEIIVSGPCVVKVVDLKGDRVRLGFQAPKWVQVFREEILTPEQEKYLGDIVGDTGFADMVQQLDARGDELSQRAARALAGFARNEAFRDPRSKCTA